ncbi:hypothetical protein F5Y12DRAFT_721314 [Xylaria sp. FL1777]|nr:hypothetical protein F5Y12DRAFT_721314 [Xylaria sp. FL1777]
MTNERRKAQSVLEFLTAKNPSITPVREGRGQNSTRHDYYCPAAVKHWDEFDYETLETIFGGDLMREAQKKRSNLPHYPHLDEDIDLRLGKGEPITRSLINKWNHTIVVASLRAVQDAFHPCFWREKTGKRLFKSNIPSSTTPDNDSEGAQNDTSQKVEEERQEDEVRQGIRKQRSKRSRQPDGGSVSLGEIMLKKSGERFPKEYKPAANWNSKKLRDGDYTNKETGEWLDVKFILEQNIAPIRQAYTYCIDYGCRYGCILTTLEAFIFRIKPRGNHRVSINDDPSSFNQLLEKVKDDGLMEFVSIPWGNGCDNHHHEYKKLTVNLALWFTHILAGNHYKLDWKYQKLRDEELVQTPQQQEPQVKYRGKKGVTHDREASLSRNRSSRNKRKRQEKSQEHTSTDEHTQEQGNQDIGNFSFPETSVPQPTIPAHHYAAGEQHKSDGSIDEESDSPPLKRRRRFA